MLFNTHTHVFNDFNKEELIKEAIKDGVSSFLFVGYDMKTSKRAIECAYKYEGSYAAVGIHPSEGHNITSNDLLALEQMLKDPKVVALGEVGLDYHYEDNPSKEKQVANFISFIHLADKMKKPLIIHMRDADQQLLDILKANKNVLHQGIMHCYSGSLEMALEFIKLGFYISFAGPLTFHNAIKLKETASILPLDKILIETDDPYLAPMPYRGQRNKPGYVKFVAQELAKLRNLSYEEIAKITTLNAKKLFKL